MFSKTDLGLSSYDIEFQSQSFKSQYQSKQVACSSFETNIVSIYNIEKNNLFGSFEGPRFQQSGDGGWTFLELAKEFDYLISINICNNRATFDVFDALKNMKRIFSLGKIQEEGIGTGDFAYNPRRSIFAYASVYGSIGYQLLDCQTLNFIKKARWQPLHESRLSSRDFNFGGERMVSIDCQSNLVVSDVDTDLCLFHLKMGEIRCGINRSRWNQKTDNLLAVTFDDCKFNLVDCERQTKLHKEALDLDASTIYWIEWEKSGNLLACSGRDKNVKVYDYREGRVVRVFKNFRSRWIYSVRWNQEGDFLAIGSRSGIMEIFEFSTGKVICEGKTFDDSNNFY